MKVLHVSGARSWGGNEQQLLYLIEELNTYGVDQYLFCYENTPLLDTITTLNLSVTVITIPFEKPYRKPYRKQLKNVVEDHNFDLIHLHTSDAVTGYTVTDLFYKLKTRTIFSKKGISRKVSALSKYKYNYKNIHKIVCVSEVVYDHFKEVLYKKNHHKLCVVHDGVKVVDVDNEFIADIKEELGVSKDIKIIGNIANHTKAKDLRTLIRTFDILINEKKVKNIHLVQMGEYSKLTPELKSLVSELNLEKFISFIGFRKKASSFLPQFDMYLMTSEREGGPTTVLEALYKKVPVVSTKVGVVGEAIADGENGFVTTIGDYESLANKLNILLEDKWLQNSFSELSYQKFIDNYTAKKLGENTFKIYQEVVKQN
ncbi:glycosyltransferase family 4 protein [Aquimarina algiphila]|uniref:glycosyltransferase family 4 protein n=1 Tax=Aquimarina algiphila TaxID=2047982 RepID=UPI002493A3F0|nr:glycosyltransferase family 4 protein [Aquimarina algiphila]